MRGNEDFSPGDLRPFQSYFDPLTGEQQGGINAGVVVLQPSEDEFRRMRQVLEDHNHSSHVATSAPEQDFLSRWFRGRWHSLHLKYNYQLHQLGYVSARNLNCERRNMAYGDISILHFSTQKKPRDFLFECGSRDFDTFVQEHFFPYCGTGAEERKRTRLAAHEWLADWQEAWKEVLAKVIESTSSVPPFTCGLCGAPRVVGDDEHCFLSCSAAQEAANPSLFAASLQSVAHVHVHRCSASDRSVAHT